MKNIKIGIAVTTRQRSNILELCIKNFIKYWPLNYDIKFVVIDDNSSVEIAAENKQLCTFGIKYFYNENRLGIAKSKNRCLTELGDCDYFFLFDDDCWPKLDGWIDYYIEASNSAKINHLMHMIQIPGLMKINEKSGISEFNNSSGVMLFFTKKCLQTVGGYNPAFGIYGMEHSEISLRIQRNGLNNGFGAYISPSKSGDYIYSLDLDLNNLGIQPEGENVQNYQFTSSLAGEEQNIQRYIQENSQQFNSSPNFVQIEKKKQIISCVMLSNTANQQLYDMTTNAINSLYNSETDYDFKVVLVETNKNYLNFGKYDCAVFLPEQEFNYNKFLNFGFDTHCYLAESDYVIIANNDLIFHNGWFSKIIESMVLYNLDSACPISPGWPYHEEAKKMYPGWKAFGGYNIGWEFCGWCIVIKKKSLNRLLPFPEELEYWCQDDYMAYKMKKFGMKHALVFESEVTHLVSKSHGLIPSHKYHHMTHGQGQILAELIKKDEPNELR